jgi:hypothetical protein
VKGDLTHLVVGDTRPPDPHQAYAGFWTTERQLEAMLWWYDRHGRLPGADQWRPTGHPDYLTQLLPSASLVQRDWGKWSLATAAAKERIEERRRATAPTQRPRVVEATQLTMPAAASG